MKFENLQFTTAFKKRGALNKGLDLTPAQCVRGVIAMSAENRCGKLGLGTDKPHEKAL